MDELSGLRLWFRKAFEQMNEFTLYRAILIGGGIAAVSLLLLGIYAKFSSPLRHWIASLRMKSVFWRDRRQRTKK